MTAALGTEEATAKEDIVDFLVIGAPKAGTTSLFEYLRHHPEISLPPDKEAPYFNDDRVYGAVPWEEYVRNAFPGPERRRLRATITPHYMFPVTHTAESGERDEYTVPRRIHQRLPGVRLIAILRDPVERAYSHHHQEARRGHDDRGFAEAVDELLRPTELERWRGRFDTANCYVTTGEYGRILGAYYETFPAEQILVLFTEELARDPEGTMRRIYDFVGVEPPPRPPRNLGKRYNVSAAEQRFDKVTPATFVKVASGNRFARRIWHSLSEEGRKRVLARYRQLDFRFHAWNRRGEAPAEEEISAADRAALERLRAHYAPDGEKLEALLERRPPWLPTLPREGSPQSSSAPNP